ncbi:HAD family hydrolase [Treponema brennaborense]|uniref:phosphoglycolate phosphatase n=1 Tax=Treponema brennaborense (strain DSM 12168 / CIP 105900 / DD5/3) TaxID=906968 RepID=F4LJC1_TREBD|nr:HAD family hydrolase [Treponema brennaborense]AEE17366.1 Haloacid dehalogenase domain protein hydrolase [Treponema brennaborense DSM 12168]
MKDSIRAVAFDIDGTLYPNWQLYFRIIPYTLKRLRFFLTYNSVRKILHRTAPLADFYEYQARLLALKMHTSPESAKTMIEKNVYCGLAPYFKRIKPFAHMKETIEKFRRAGYKLAVLSDFPPAQKGSIWGTLDMFDVVCGSEELGALKPSKYTFGVLASKLGVAENEILYVGNSVSADVRGASAAGMKTAYLMPLWRIILNKPLQDADISFKSYRHLQKIVLQ